MTKDELILLCKRENVRNLAGIYRRIRSLYSAYYELSRGAPRPEMKPALSQIMDTMNALMDAKAYYKPD